MGEPVVTTRRAGRYAAHQGAVLQPLKVKGWWTWTQGKRSSQGINDGRTSLGKWGRTPVSVESRSRPVRCKARQRHSCCVAHARTKTEGLSLKAAPKGRGESPGEVSPSSFPHSSFPAVRSKVAQLHHSWAGLGHGQPNPGLCTGA